MLRANLRCGPHVVETLPDQIAELGYRIPGLVVDGSVLDASSYARAAVESLRRRFPAVVILEYREPFEPTYQFLDRVSGSVRAGDGPAVDCLVGIGGGSVMDTAKALAMLATNPGEALRYRGFPTDIRAPLPNIAVPTTAGTGSEVAYNAVFTDENEQRKLGINSVLNYPILGILDPLLVVGAPRGVMLSSGLDALVHTLEGYVSVKATALSRLFSAEAFRRVMCHLPALMEDPSSVADAQEMQIGAAFAMLGMSNASSGPSGALSYYLGTHFKVPHGHAGAVFIGHVMAMNHRHGWYGLGDLAPLLPGGADAEATPEARSGRVVAVLTELLARLGVPATLAPYELGPAQLPELLQLATVTFKAAFALNPVAFTSSDLRSWLGAMTGGTA